MTEVRAISDNSFSYSGAWFDRIKISKLTLTPALEWPETIVTNVHDGDTVTVDVDLGCYVGRKDSDLGFHVRVQSHHLHIHQSLRLIGINAPELSTPAGKKSQVALAGKLPLGSKIKLITWADRNDKYGRLLGQIFLGKTDINQWMIDNGWAVAWDGSGPKPT